MALLKSRIARLENTVKAQAEAIEALTDSLKPLLKDLESVIAVMQAATGAFKVLEFIGRIGKPVTYLATLFAAGYGIWTKSRGQ